MNFLFTGSFDTRKKLFCFFFFGHIINRTLVKSRFSILSLNFLKNFTDPSDPPLCLYEIRFLHNRQTESFSDPFLFFENEIQVIRMDYIFPFNPGYEILLRISGDLFNSTMQKYRNKVFICLEGNPVEIQYERAVFPLTFLKLNFCNFGTCNIFQYSYSPVRLTLMIRKADPISFSI